jgi:hypothetical protein
MAVTRRSASGAVVTCAKERQKGALMDGAEVSDEMNYLQSCQGERRKRSSHLTQVVRSPAFPAVGLRGGDRGNARARCSNPSLNPDPMPGKECLE